MSKEKTAVLANLASLLNQIQGRLSKTARETRQNTDLLAILRDEIRLKAGRAEGIAVDANDKAERAHLALIYHGESIDKLKKEAEDREGRQTLRDQNNVQSLVNLRDSTAKGFDQVAADVKSLLTAVQRINERIGQVESQNLSLASTVSLLQNRLNAPAPAPSIPSDHVWLNKKLTGVYDSLEDLENKIQGPCAAFHHMVGIEKRVAELEAEIGLVIDLRKAQAAFVLGPRRNPSPIVPSNPSGNTKSAG